MPTPVSRASLALTTFLLATASVSAFASADAAPAPEPAPSPVWDASLSSTSGIFGPGYVAGLDAFGGRTYRADTDYDSESSDSNYEFEIRDAKGKRIFLDNGDPTLGTTMTGIDAGSWGAVTGGTVDGTLDGQTSAGATDGWVRRYEPDGHVRWTAQFGTATNDSVSGVTVVGDTVVAVGASNFSTPVIYTFDLDTGAASGPLAIDVPAQNAQLLGVATLGDDVVITGTTDRQIDSEDESSAYAWIARLDGADLTHVVWETNGPGAESSGTPFGNPLLVFGGNVYTASLYTGIQGTLSSINGATGAPRWSKVIGVYRAALDLTAYRGDVVVAGLQAHGITGGPTLTYDSLLVGYSPAGVKLWSGQVDEDDSDAIVYLTAATSSSQTGLVVTGVTGESPSSASFGRFVTGLRVRAPKTLVKTTGGFTSEASTSVKRGRSVKASIKLTNVGELADRISLKGCVTPASVTMVVKDGKKNVTGTVRNGKYKTASLGVGKSRTLSVTVTAGPKANLRTLVCKVESSSVANPDNTSTGVLRVAIKK